MGQGGGLFFLQIHYEGLGGGGGVWREEEGEGG
jgi:hypothetical protein